MPIPAILMSVAGSVIGGLLQKAFGSSEQAAPAPPPAPNALGKDDFLRLLTVQLRNQDPLNPISNTDFIAQTAQFTSLEQLQNMNQNLQKVMGQLGGGAASSGPASAAALLGRSVTVNGSPLTFDGANAVGLQYQLPAAAPSVFLQVVDESGAAVRTLALGQQGGGVHQIVFDGRDDQGRALAPGTYTYRVAAADAGGKSVPGIITGGGQVSGISVDGGQLMLLIGTARVPLSSVVGVMAGTAQ
jgi:flagellar basal-body rod modification protein FlgD